MRRLSSLQHRIYNLLALAPPVVKVGMKRLGKSTYLFLPRLFLSPLCTGCWRRGAVVSGVRRMNEVNARRARLVPGWVTVFGRVYHLGM